MNTNEFSAKNDRIITALRNRQPYMLLEAENEYYSLIQINNDRIPVPVLHSILGQTGDIVPAIGYEPEYVGSRDTTIETTPGSLLSEIVKAMLSSIADDDGKTGYWRVDDGGATARVTTRFSRDDRYSDNGGDYYEHRRWAVKPAGVVSWDSSSCDFWQPDPRETLYRIDVTDLSAIFERAEAIVKALQAGELVPVCPTCGKPHEQKGTE